MRYIYCRRGLTKNIMALFMKNVCLYQRILILIVTHQKDGLIEQNEKLKCELLTHSTLQTENLFKVKVKRKNSSINDLKTNMKRSGIYGRENE